MPKQTQTPGDLAQAVSVAVDLLSRRDHYKQELLLKLQQRGFYPEVLELAVQRCEAEGWLREANYARIYVRQRAHKGYGPKRIQQELQQRGISSVDRQLAFESLEQEECFDWFESAKCQKEKKFGLEVASDFRLKQKQQAYLYGRGFSSEQIRYACLGE